MRTNKKERITIQSEAIADAITKVMPGLYELGESITSNPTSTAIVEIKLTHIIGDSTWETVVRAHTAGYIKQKPYIDEVFTHPIE